MQRVSKKDLQSTAKNEKIYIETQELKLKQQRMSLMCSMTESQCITFASYKRAMQIAKYQKSFLEGEFLKQCFIEIALMLLIL